MQPLIEFFRIDYSNPAYKSEAEISNPNYTPSRMKIYAENPEIFDGITSTCSVINTITTKQDRNPNSGLLRYHGSATGKAPYRNLTPRECFLLMGFDEADFQALMDNDFELKKNHPFCTREKLIRMAGNSIVVNVLESIFRQVVEIQETILQKSQDHASCYASQKKSKLWSTSDKRKIQLR